MPRSAIEDLTELVVSPEPVTELGSVDEIEAGRLIGTYQPRIDGYERVSGKAKYAADWKVPDMLYGSIIQSSIPHGIVKRIDTGKALSIKGVKAVITCFDDNTFWSAGEREHTRRVFTDQVRFVGDCIGALAAESREIAQVAAESIEVEYGELPAVFTLKDSLKPDAPKIWEDGNAIGPLKYGFGNVVESFGKTDLVIERTYSTSRVHNTPLEPGVSLAWWNEEEGKLTVVAATQSIHGCRDGLAKDLGLPVTKVRVIAYYKGGGFGNKANSMNYDLISALLAKKTKRPVMVEYTREQDFTGVHGRWSTEQHLRAALNRKDGKLLSVELNGYCDIGAYTRHVKHNSFMNGAENYYSCESWSAQIYGVYTNTPATAHMRAPTGPQSCFALETLMDETSHELNIDPVEFRLKNVTGLYHPDKTFVSNSMAKCLKVGSEMFGWREKWRAPDKKSLLRTGVSGDILDENSTKRRGVGVAIANMHAYVGKGEALLKLKKDGTLDVHVGVVDIGTGAKSTMAIIAADTFGVPLDEVRIIWGDTESCPYSPGESGSRTTTFVGTAVRATAQKLKQRILSLASNYFNVKVEDLNIVSGRIIRIDSDARTSRTSDYRSQASSKKTISINLGRFLELIGKDEVSEQQITQPSLPEHKGRYAFAAHFAEIEADIETGKIRVVRYVAAHESGEIINRLTAESQVRGCVVMGMGMALSEKLIIDSNYGTIQNPHMFSYRLADHTMIPKIDVALLESEDDPYGPKSIGEIGLNPVPAVIGNAIFNATGVRLRDLPFMPEQLLQAIG